MRAPINPYYTGKEIEQRVLLLAADLRRGYEEGTPEGDALEQSALQELEDLSRGSQPVLDRLEHALHPWTSYVIIPIFALANAGVELSGSAVSDAASSPVSWGVALGLMIGKPAGILLFAFLAVRLGIAALPTGVGWSRIAGAGVVAGIGFTVSLFITELAFTSPQLVDEAKIGILAASTLMGLIGYLVLRMHSESAQADATPAQNEKAPAVPGLSRSSTE